LTFTRFAQQIVPPPRKPVTFADAVPLLIYTAFALTLLAVLTFGHVLIFTSLTPLWLLVLLPWVWWMSVVGYSGLSGWRKHASLYARFALLTLLAMTLAEPRMVRSSDAMQVIYVVDRSASVADLAVDQAGGFIFRTGAQEKPAGDEMGLIYFGRDAAVELAPSMSYPLQSDREINVVIDREGTDIAGALSLAGAMLSEEQPARIVLVSDGTQTEGRLTQVLNDLKARKIPVDVLPFEYEYEHEVWLERLELPRFVKTGETYEANVIVSSLQDGRGTLVLSENGQVISEEPVEFQAGKNRFSLPIYLREAGYYEYVASIRVDEKVDSIKVNNTAISYLYLEGEGKVLLVVDPARGDDSDFEPMKQALTESKREVEVCDAYEFPRDSMALMPYDAVVFVNVPRETFDVVQMQAMREAVYDLGIGLLMLGGENSFGPGGYHRTAIEETLPVTMDITTKKVLPKSALVVILHTCEFPQGNTWAKKITKQAINVLGDRDEAGVLAYGTSGRDEWLFKLMPVSQREQMFKAINNASIGDMPSFSPTMQMALNGLKNSDAASKHMIVISDGDPSAPTDALVQQFAKNRITVTTISIQPHGGFDIETLRLIAKATGGNYYPIMDPAKLPSIFIREAKTLRRSMIQDKVTFTPRSEYPGQILKGIEQVPPLHGYVLTSAKPRSELMLVRENEDEELDPVLAVWNFGVGKAAAWTSDLATNWGRDWVNWQKYQAFVKQLMIGISRVSKTGKTRMQAFAEGSQGIIVVEDYAPEDSFLEIQAQVDGPRDFSERVMLKQVGPRRYEGRFDLGGEGTYKVRAVAVGEGRSEETFGGFAVPYSQEYLKFSSSPLVLEQIADRTDGRMLSGRETGKELFGADRDVRRSSKPVPDWFLIALAILIPLDVGLRRVQVDLATVKGWLGITDRRRSDETLGALLKRKTQVRGERQRDEARPPPRPASPSQASQDMLEVDLGGPPPGPQTKQEKTPQAPPAAGEEDDGSTTSRLLRMKKQRQQESED